MASGVVTLIVLLALTATAEAPSSPEPFAYAGFGLTTDPQSLVAKFPRSTHEFLESHSGTTHLLAIEGEANFQQALRSEPGKYRIRLSENESVTGIYFLEFDMAGGKIQAVELSFEKPEASLKAPLTSQEQRFPPCGPILSSLTTQYGKPARSRSWTEEALDLTRRTWHSGNEQLSLTCGQYWGRKKVFAVELNIAR